MEMTMQGSGKSSGVQLPEQEDTMFSYPVIDMRETGQNIMRLRVQNGYSVRQLQDIFGFATPQAIYKWQHGTTMPTIDNLIILSALFHVPVDEIVAVHDMAPMEMGA